MGKSLEKQIFNIRTADAFAHLALEVFRFQYEKVAIYRKFCDLLGVGPEDVKRIEEIPFLPIQFFKSHKILVENAVEEAIFTSSGTTGQVSSKHYISDIEIYEKSFQKAFRIQYGHPSKFTFLALLPSYLERDGSSLVYMVDQLTKESGSRHSGFYLNEMEALIEKLEYLEKNRQPCILIGVSYALLDLIEAKNFKLKNTIVMETGGMKGRRKEMIKEELHAYLKASFGVDAIHSEYGMTELLSQAYSKGEGIFSCPPWMQVLTRDTEDALSFSSPGSGGINVIDLANINSCAFIATQDLGKTNTDGTFEVLGRFDTSDIRGCNLMVL